MAGISRASRQNLLDHILGTTAMSVTAQICVALYTAAPSAIAGGTEVTASTGYVRVTHTSWVAATAAEPSVAFNDGIITYPTATGSWGAILAIGLYNTVTAGTFFGYASITTKTIGANDVARFAASQISVSLDETA